MFEGKKKRKQLFRESRVVRFFFAVVMRCCECQSLIRLASTRAIDNAIMSNCVKFNVHQLTLVT